MSTKIPQFSANSLNSRVKQLREALFATLPNAEVDTHDYRIQKIEYRVMASIISGIVAHSTHQVPLASTNVCNQSKKEDLTIVRGEEAPKICEKWKDDHPSYTLTFE